jgi:hypothetical protein
MPETKNEPTPMTPDERMFAAFWNVATGFPPEWTWKGIAAAIAVSETKRQRDALLAAAKGVFEGDDPDPEELRPAWRALYDAILECEQSAAGQAVLAAVPETKRQRDELLAMVRECVAWMSDVQRQLDYEIVPKARSLIAECEQSDA